MSDTVPSESAERRCDWPLVVERHVVVFCNAKATHQERHGFGTNYFCRDHAGDYIDVFGPDSVSELPVREEKT